MTEEQVVRAAAMWLALGDEEAAALELGQLAGEAWERPDVVALRLRICLRQADDVGCAECAARLLDLSPELIGAQACFDLAVLFCWLEEFESAEAWLRSAFELDPSEAMWRRFCDSSDLDELWVRFSNDGSREL